MAKHLMAVCVVCLLCADHLPCQQHFWTPDTSTTLEHLIKADKSHPDLFTNHHNTNDQTINTNQLDYHNSKNYLENDDNLFMDLKKSNRKITRTKRHAGHHHHHHGDDDDHHETTPPENENTKLYIQKLFEKFSDGENKDTMSIEGFERMIDKLGLYNLKLNDTISSPQPEQTENNNEKCLTSIEIFHRVSSTPKNFEYGKLTDSTNTTTSNSNVTSIQHQQNATKTAKKTTFLSSEDLKAVCPILLHILTTETSLERSGCMSDSSLYPAKHVDHDDSPINVRDDLTRVWVYSSLSILGVSLCGLLGVAVIPCMEKHFYNQLLQFLVALAVGTLTGDALLHLLPHSFASVANNGEDAHKSMIIKGLIAVLGIIVFFFTERALNMIADWRKNRQKKEKPCSRVRVMRDQSSIKASSNTPNNEKICKNKYSSYPYCYDEIAMDTKDDHHHHHTKNTCDKTGPNNSQPSGMEKQQVGNHQNHKDNIHENQETTEHNLLKYNNENNKEPHKNVTAAISFGDNVEVIEASEKLMPEENFTVILREHESKHHGHSHTHGHVHSPPGSLSSVAWMVVMGDGLHNFTDGMTIGAAFSNSIPGGFSTAVAVFCHELPHELGDFAVLLKAGMSAKQAVYYNILSSVLSFFGMMFGIWLGEIPEASAWIFACAAGLFIYIALVDMMPEITQSHKDAGFLQCFLQLLGMLCGLGIMLVIAFYEDDLMQIFTN